ncbi:MAG: neutral zinc metallopeptidase [Actinomycetota bacterium]|nr:neutral zinc metallopeptidase [Actinomycetota bacterium]
MRRLPALLVLVVATAGCSLSNLGSDDDPIVAETVPSSAPAQAEAPASTVLAPDGDDPAAAPGDLAYAEIVNRSVASLDAFWAEQLPAAYGIEYTPLAGVQPWDPRDESTLPACNGRQQPIESYANNAFYCRADDYIGWDDTGLMPRLYQEYGDAAVALVLSHEWGHALQARLDVDIDAIETVYSELQADCFAGAWAASVIGGSSSALALDVGDVDEAISGYLLFRDPPGTDPAAEQSHGSAFDRVGAFGDGFRVGPGICAAIVDGDYPLADIEPADDFEDTEGNAPFSGDKSIFELVVGDLEGYWRAHAPEVTGQPWDPTGSAVPVDPRGEDVICGDEAIAPEVLAANVVWCAADDYVAWDRDGLMLPLYEDIGDFAVALLLANAWGDKALALAGVDGDPVEMELASDCLAGAWATSVWQQDRLGRTADDGTALGVATLSAGDLDEGIAGLLAVQDPAIARLDITAFDRADAFRRGFALEDPAACLPGATG